MNDYYTVDDLKDRGWTATIIRDHLGKPDKEHPNRQSSLRKPIGLYSKDRVLKVERGPAKHDLAKIKEGRELAKRALRLKKQRGARPFK